MLASVGIEAIRTPVASPRANAFAERFVRTAREDCLDHLLVISRRRLEVVLSEYIHHYNHARPHRGLALAQPVPRPVASACGVQILESPIELGQCRSGLIGSYQSRNAVRGQFLVRAFGHQKSAPLGVISNST